MPHAFLMDVPRSEMEVYNLVKQAKETADLYGHAPSVPVPPITGPAVLIRMRTLDLGVNLNRSYKDQEQVLSILIPLMIEAYSLDYNVNQKEVFASLLWLASAIFASKYVPMRVLGATIEGMIKPQRKLNDN